MWGDCPSSSLRSLSEQWHHCGVFSLWHYQICGDCWRGKEQKSDDGNEKERWKDACIDRDRSSIWKKKKERDGWGGRGRKPGAAAWLNSQWTSANLFSPEPVACSKGARFTCFSPGCCGAGLRESWGWDKWAIWRLSERYRGQEGRGFEAHFLLHYSLALGLISHGGVFLLTSSPGWLETLPPLSGVFHFKACLLLLAGPVWADGSPLSQLSACINQPLRLCNL